MAPSSPRDPRRARPLPVQRPSLRRPRVAGPVTAVALRALDLLGMHREAAEGLDQWLSLPLEPRASPGTHGASKPDRPLGHFGDGRGCLTHAVGPEGLGGNMDAVHSMG